MSFIIWTFVLAIVFIVYKFQLRDLGTSSSWMIATIEVTVLSFLVISSSNLMVIFGVVLIVVFYFANHYLQSYY